MCPYCAQLNKTLYCCKSFVMNLSPKRHQQEELLHCIYEITKETVQSGCQNNVSMES